MSTSGHGQPQQFRTSKPSPHLLPQSEHGAQGGFGNPGCNGDRGGRPSSCMRDMRTMTTTVIGVDLMPQAEAETPNGRDDGSAACLLTLKRTKNSAAVS